jgi:hypothetical protein
VADPALVQSAMAGEATTIVNGTAAVANPNIR